MASPFAWAVAMTWELVNSQARMVRNVGWGIFWTLVWGVLAVALLAIALSNFDRLLGRVEEGSARLSHGARSRSQNVSSAIYVGWVLLTLIAAILTLPGLGPFVNGVLVWGGLLLVSVKAALSMAEDRLSGAVEAARHAGYSTFHIAFAKWLGIGRFVLPLALLSLLTVLGRREPDFALWRGMVLMVVYVISAGGTFAALGLALGARLPTGWAVTSSIALYTYCSLNWVMTSWTFPPADDGLWLWIGSPLVGVGVVTAELMGVPSLGIYNLFWVIAWMAVHNLAAAGLLAATSAILERGAAQHSEESPLLRLARRPSVEGIKRCESNTGKVGRDRKFTNCGRCGLLTIAMHS